MARRTHCRICGSHRLHLFLNLGETPLANRFLKAPGEEEPSFPLDVYLCEECSLVQLGYVVPPEVLFKDYIYVTGTSATMPRHFAALAEEVTRRFLSEKKDALVVEAGSNDGTLLLAFLERGVKVLGVEPATNIAEIARKRGVETRDDFFSQTLAEEVREERGPADVVVGNNVFAHVDDIHDFVRGVDTLLAEDGIFVFEVPYLFDLLDHVEFDTIYHEHLSYFSLTALAHLFRARGFSLFDVEHHPIHGGSLRVFVQREGGPHAPTEAPMRFLKEEEARGVLSRAPYEAFAQKVFALREELVGLLRKLREEGASVAGYGSPAKGNTLLNFMKLGPELISYLVDKSPLKQGLFTPGMRLPVYPVERLLTDRPEYALILAWNFAEEIIAQQAEYLATGGKFIVPLPRPQIISHHALQ